MLYQQKPIQVFRLYILMSSMVAFVVLCLREDACWSLSGSKGLMNSCMISFNHKWQCFQFSLHSFCQQSHQTKGEVVH